MISQLIIETAKTIVEAADIRRKQAVRRTMKGELRRSVSKELHIRQMEEIERILVRVLRPFFRDQILDAAARLATVYASGKEGGLGSASKSFLSNKDFDGTAEILTNQIFDPQQWQDALVDRVAPYLARIMGEAALSTLLMIGVDPRKSVIGIQKYRPGQPRDSHGRFTSGGGRTETAATRRQRALNTYKPSSKAKQDHAEAAEVELARKLRGKKSGDNKEVDVSVQMHGVTHGIELKTMLDNGNDKITMHPDSRRRKEAWARKKGRKLHTVVIDDRDIFAGGANKDQYSGHRIYYKKGVGAFRLNTMQKIKSFAELKRVLAGTKDIGELL